ncbi:uncharacterized protein NECHADRAFT_77809 [Fusarium vanettenii 77-13-4]|uniref:Uncharacterized protein n=1 Tax=Fusarium vanettenii (strain ATCC MYA-4622 / CBS 123669 / FGSC 9596 / NRRL 45880 / 77-13-4) TaxID=660122 RepID=C7YMA3_FUSV7|nr:uncharacterized protein NECHADRAFT_77809 [Fusarium vanettenii 77-13-4]EEU46911.1 predicted protein [Fusarium vanettenii 77-13-4]
MPFRRGDDGVQKSWPENLWTAPYASELTTYVLYLGYLNLEATRRPDVRSLVLSRAALAVLPFPSVCVPPSSIGTAQHSTASTAGQVKQGPSSGYLVTAGK